MKSLMQLETAGYSSNTVHFVFSKLLSYHENYVISYYLKILHFLLVSFIHAADTEESCYTQFLQLKILHFRVLSKLVVSEKLFGGTGYFLVSSCWVSACERAQFFDPNSRALLFLLGPHGQSCQESHIPSGWGSLFGNNTINKCVSAFSYAFTSNISGLMQQYS